MGGIHLLASYISHSLYSSDSKREKREKETSSGLKLGRGPVWKINERKFPCFDSPYAVFLMHVQRRSQNCKWQPRKFLSPDAKTKVQNIVCVLSRVKKPINVVAASGVLLYTLLKMEANLTKPSFVAACFLNVDTFCSPPNKSELQI